MTSPLPATSNPAHMADDARAGFGRVPVEAMRPRIMREHAHGSGRETVLENEHPHEHR